MSRVVKVGIVFDYYPDEDELIVQENFTEAELIDYYKNICVEDIESFVNHNEVYDNVNVEIVEETK